MYVTMNFAPAAKCFVLCNSRKEYNVDHYMFSSVNIANEFMLKGQTIIDELDQFPNSHYGIEIVTNAINYSSIFRPLHATLHLGLSVCP